MQAFIRDEQEKLYNSLSPPSPQLIRNWRFASQTWQSQTSNFKPAISFPSPTPSKPAHHHQDCWKGQRCTYERNRPNTIERRFQYATWLVNLGQYSHLPVCATSSIPSFTGVHQRQVYIDELRFNIFTRRSKGHAPLGEPSASRRSSTRKKR